MWICLNCLPEVEREKYAAKAACDPLDHDGDGRRGGSLKGENSTRAKGRRKK